MRKTNKAHTATANRIARRYGGQVQSNGAPDVTTPEMTIEVSTAAALRRAIKLLQEHTGELYLAVTNQETVSEAIRATQGTAIGVMDPKGNIVKAFAAT